MLGWAPLLMAHEEHPTDVPQVRRTLAALVHRVELDPETRAIRVHYRIDLSAQPLHPVTGCTRPRQRPSRSLPHGGRSPGDLSPAQTARKSVCKTRYFCQDQRCPVGMPRRA
jgi:hypothetical protein